MLLATEMSKIIAAAWVDEPDEATQIELDSYDGLNVASAAISSRHLSLDFFVGLACWVNRLEQ
jgi:hypothetical protein